MILLCGIVHFFLLLTAATVNAQLPLWFRTCPIRDGAQIFGVRGATCEKSWTGQPQSGYEPWTHRPICLQQEGSPTGELYCIYTNANFNGGAGASFVTTPDIGARLAALPKLRGDDKEKAATGAPYYKKQTPGRGMSVFADRDFKAGEVISTDFSPLTIITESIFLLGETDSELVQWMATLQLPPDTQKLVLSLASSHDGDLLSSILKTNSIRLSFGDSPQHVSLMPEAARMNHDCRPNAMYRFNATSLAFEVFALQGINRDEEVNYSYIDTYLDDRTTSDRRTGLKQKWNFECACSICSSSADEVNASDTRRQLIQETKEKLWEARADLRDIITHAREILRLYDEEGLIAPRGKYLDILTYSSSQLGELEDTKRNAREARLHWEIMAGKESIEAERMGAMEIRPQGHPSWRLGVKGKD